MWGKNNIPFLGGIKRKILFFGEKYFCENKKPPNIAAGGERTIITKHLYFLQFVC
jgi:hypothetical protein